MMQEMMNNFNRMSLQTGGNGVNPLIQAQMMNELKYRRLYEEEKHRNENLERKMTSFVDRIERHKENNMKIKAKYNNEIDHMRYQINLLERENEDLRISANVGGEELQNQVRDLTIEKGLLEENIEMLKKDLEMANNKIKEQEISINPDKERELESQVESLKLQIEKNEEELKIAREIAEEERQKGGKERNETEIERHKLQLDVEHWKGQTDQMERQVMNLKDMLTYERGAKMRLEDRIRELESRSFGGWNNKESAFQKEETQNRETQNKDSERGKGGLEAYRNIINQNKVSSSRDNNTSRHNQYHSRRNNAHSTQQKEDIVFGKPSFPKKKAQTQTQNKNKKRSNSPFAIDEQFNAFGRGQQSKSNYRGQPSGPLQTNASNQRSEVSHRTNRTNVQMRQNNNWGTNKTWANDQNKETEDSGNFDSIASKRMAVRMGRGKGFSVN